MNTCNNCGCVPKPDEWSSATLCIDCQHNEEENDDIRTDDKRNNLRGLGRISTMAYGFEYSCHSYWLSGYIICMILDSWIFYLIILVFGVLAFYLMDVGIFK